MDDLSIQIVGQLAGISERVAELLEENRLLREIIRTQTSRILELEQEKEELRSSFPDQL